MTTVEYELSSYTIEYFGDRPSVTVTYPTHTTGPGGAVDSVNGQTGVVVLTAASVGAATTAQGALADTATQPSMNLLGDGDVLF